MRINAEKALPKTVTIINKLRAKDNKTGKDIYYKKKLVDCFWSVKQLSAQAGQTITHSDVVAVHIPKGQEFVYLTYDKWKTQIEDCFTLSVDDYLIQGEVSEEVTPENITDLLQRYAPNTCRIKHINDLTMPSDTLDHNGGFLLKYANMIYVEGV